MPTLEMTTAQARSARDVLIVALDCPSLEESLDLVEKLGDSVRFYKIGWRLFLQGGLPIVDRIRDMGKEIFLDLKMDDIEETIQNAVREVAGKATFLTVQGSAATVRAAVRGRGAHADPKLLFVPLLSSLDEAHLEDVYSLSPTRNDAPTVSEYVLHRAGQALANGAEGLIASGGVIGALRDRFGAGPVIVCPGIRPATSATNDHRRSTTPADAVHLGATHLVVGRPIYAALDPVEAAAAILGEISDGLGQLAQR